MCDWFSDKLRPGFFKPDRNTQFVTSTASVFVSVATASGWMCCALLLLVIAQLEWLFV